MEQLCKLAPIEGTECVSIAEWGQTIPKTEVLLKATSDVSQTHSCAVQSVPKQRAERRPVLLNAREVLPKNTAFGVDL